MNEPPAVAKEPLFTPADAARERAALERERADTLELLQAIATKWLPATADGKLEAAALIVDAFGMCPAIHDAVEPPVLAALARAAEWLPSAWDGGPGYVAGRGSDPPTLREAKAELAVSIKARWWKVRARLASIEDASYDRIITIWNDRLTAPLPAQPGPEAVSEEVLALLERGDRFQAEMLQMSQARNIAVYALRASAARVRQRERSPLQAATVLPSDPPWARRRISFRERDAEIAHAERTARYELSESAGRHW